MLIMHHHYIKMMTTIHGQFTVMSVFMFNPKKVEQIKDLYASNRKIQRQI